MRQDDRGWPDAPTELPIAGKTVTAASFCKDDKGYPTITLKFSDGTVFTIEETGQCGSIEFEVCGGSSGAEQDLAKV